MKALKKDRLQIVLLLGLILSLGLNVFMLSYVFGQKRAIEHLQADMLSLQVDGDAPDHSAESRKERIKRVKGFAEVSQMLTPEGREIVKESFSPVMAEAQDLRQELTAARQSLSDLSASEDFTEEKYMEAMREMERKQGEMKRLVRRAVMRAMVQLSPEDRKIIAKHHKKMMRGTIQGKQEE